MHNLALDGELKDGRHTQVVRVYYEDTDFTGIVYHANYLRYMERGRTNYLRLIGADHRLLFEQTEKEAPGFAFVVRAMTIDFLKPARMDDILHIVSEPVEVKGASVTIRQKVMRGDELLLEAQVKVAFISGGRAKPIPKPLRIAMSADQDSARARRRRDHDRHRREPAAHVNPLHMRWSKQSGRESRGYHHGNLKEALMRAAIELIAEKGPGGFTFADAARWAGVSAAAPYRHYRDRDALLSDVARRGFEMFEQRLLKAWDEGRPKPHHRLRADRQSVSRVRARGARFLLRDVRSRHSARRDAGIARRRVIAPSRFCATPAKSWSRLLPASKRPPALMMALHIWAMSHGIASLFARGESSQRKLPMSAEDLLEAQILIYLRGLGLDASAAARIPRP